MNLQSSNSLQDNPNPPKAVYPPYRLWVNSTTLHFTWLWPINVWGIREEMQRGGVEGLIRELKAAVGNGVVPIGRTPAVSSLGRSLLVLSLLQCKDRLSQGSLKYCSLIIWMNSFVLLLYMQRTISEDSSHPSKKNYKSLQSPAGRAERLKLWGTERFSTSLL